MAFWKCYYHAIWSTRQREPLITPDLEPVIFDAIKRKSTELKCEVLAINGIADHIHVAVSIPPRLAAVSWIRHVKGLSSHEANEMFPNQPSIFRWQTSYGLLTFGAKNLPVVLAYIANQKTHHANNTVIPYLEQTDDSD